MNWVLHRSVHGKFALYYLLISLFLITALGRQYEKCILNGDTQETNIKRYPYYKNNPVTIIIDTSDRITHQLSSHAFRIFAQEVLGYPRVEISEYQDHFDIISTVDRLSDQENLSIPISTINLEVWIPPDYDTLLQIESMKSVEDCGNIASTGGRFGWFVPKDMIHPFRKFYNEKWFNDMTEVQWTLFRNPELSSYFDINESDKQFVQNNALKNPEKQEYFCSNCTNGMFIPERCKRNKCALLLAPDYLSTSFVVEHIEELQLYVKVVWLGGNLQKVLNVLMNQYKSTNSEKSLIMITWTPSIIVTDERKFVSVAFKKCELLKSTKHLGCKYEINRLVKFAWNGLQEFGKPLLESLRQYTFGKNDYDDLLRTYVENPEKGVEAAACEWLKNHKWTSESWKPVLESKIYIGGIFPMHNSPFGGEGIAYAAQMAAQAINRNKSILTDYKLEVLMSDGQCRSDLVMKVFIDYVVNKQFSSLIGVLGPACSDTVEPLASVSKHYQTMIISYSAEGASFSDRNQYPYFFRTIGENKHYIHVYVKFLKYMGWKQVAALTEDGQKYTEYISEMQSLLADNQITFITNIKFLRAQEGIVMTKYLEDLKRKRARIIIADVVNEVARLIMCEAYKLKMTAREGYVWFLPISYNTIQGGNINCTAEEMAEAINGYFSMAHAYYGEDDMVMQENITVKEWRQKYEKSKKQSNYAGYAYDAVWTYALATDKLAKTDPEALSHIHSNTTIKKLLAIINDTDFNGVSGRIKFRGGPSRFSVINIIQWYNNESHIVGQFHPNLTDHRPEILGGRLEINSSLIKWFTHDGKRPDDGKLPPEVCPLDGLAKFFNVECSMAIVILNIMVITTVVVVVGLIIYKIKKRYDQKVQSATEDYMKSLGFDWWHNIEGLKDLSQWEVARGNVVINRKIGEGAFGNVYGGEALFNGDWLPVAVKTLKTGSSNDEKIDFLSEADVMRNFTHSNIVKLLGVIMNDEPLYTIMEYMLYGDLKSYLLSRRHLIDVSSDEVSNERLTSMALDIARGLSYLAEMKFVHRDMASRNCLVNANRTVKIGDFGMCRPMAEKEYYRFSRKGMLPVRWMAPESLAFGIFTTASDIWSYGVILYEIVTFGSFPYQGMSNSEVLQAVKNGRCLSIPKGVKPQLEALMNSCFKKDAKERPQAKGIVAFIAGYKELLTVCLDAPLSSVQLEDSEELEMHFPDRKCSTPTIKNISSTSNGFIPSVPPDEPMHKFKRQKSAPDNSVSIPLDCYCPKEPLLGSPRASSNIAAKYVNKQHVSNDSGVQDDDDYIPASMLNGQVLSKI